MAHGQQSARIVKYHINDIVNVRGKMRYMAPTVLAVTPPINATGVPQNAVLSAQASPALDATTVNNQTYSLIDRASGKYVSGTISQNPDASSAFLLPSSLLLASTPYELLLNNPSCCITDLAGNAIGSGVYPSRREQPPARPLPKSRG